MQPTSGKSFYDRMQAYSVRLRRFTLCAITVLLAACLLLLCLMLFTRSNTAQAHQAMAPESTPTSTTTITPTATITPTPLPFGREVIRADIEPGITNDTAWGDVDNDGDLDVAVANEDGEYLIVYINGGGVFTRSLDWNPHIDTRARSVAWGDADGNGYLDLAVAWGDTGESPYGVFLNHMGILADTAISFGKPITKFNSMSVAWGDIDNDGRLDLVFGNGEFDTGNKIGDDPCQKKRQQRNVVYKNITGLNGSLQFTLAWTSPISAATNSVALADIDDDGDLDIAVGNGIIGGNDGVLPNCVEQHSYIYVNRLHETATTTITFTPITLTESISSALSVAWGDVNRDGAPDLAVGNNIKQPNQIFCNKNKGTEFPLCWISTDETAKGIQEDTKDRGKYNTRSVAWGDADGDGDLDLAVGNHNQPNQIYCNETERGFITPTLQLCWNSAESEDFPLHTADVAWVDFDSDGELDLATGNGGRADSKLEPNLVYINAQTRLQPLETDGLPLTVASMDLGDVDRDGDLDLVVGLNKSNIVHIYSNQGGQIQWKPSLYTITTEISPVRSVAFGDLDHDGDPDLAVGGGKTKELGNVTQVYSNTWTESTTGTFTLIPSAAQAITPTSSVAWGDMDSDGYLDLAVGKTGFPNAVYLYSSTLGTLLANPSWISAQPRNTAKVVWGDMDNDGDPDLAVANQGQPAQVYRNMGGRLEQEPSWTSSNPLQSSDLAWGDFDGNGYLDLALVNGIHNAPKINYIYKNLTGTLITEPIWQSQPLPATGIDWQDIDLDGDLDLTILNSSVSANLGLNRVYLNSNNQIGADFVEWGREKNGEANRSTAYSMVWGDLDRDGDLDVIDGHNGTGGHVIINQRVSDTYTLTARLYITTPVLPIDSSHVSVGFTLYGLTNTTYTVKAFYSLNGVGRWMPITPTATVSLTNLRGSPIGVNGELIFDTIQNNIMGRADNFVLRLIALPVGYSTDKRKNAFTGPILYPAAASNSQPFSVKGRQIRVVHEDPPGVGTKGAFVMYLDEPRNLFFPYASNRSAVYQTDNQGYLQGFGQQISGTQLVALYPVTNTESYTLYQTSGWPTATGRFTPIVQVSDNRVTTLTISAARQLYLFNLDISLEWDARREPAYLQQLEDFIRRASAILYNVSDGQMALGDVNIYQNKERWRESNVQVYASNRFRPNADMGGIVTRPLTITFGTTATVGLTVPNVLRLPEASQIYTTGIVTNAIYPGQVRMPALWNRFGSPGNDGGDDWARAFAHELAHYLLFLPDHYLQVDPNKGDTLVVDGENCQRSIMRDAYQPIGTIELVSDSEWKDCQQTIAERVTRLSDWEMINARYGISNSYGIDSSANDNRPRQFLLDLNHITVHNPASSTTPRLDPFFYVKEDNESKPLSSFTMQAYLFRPYPRGTLVYTDVIALGAPIANQIFARGVQVGDRLCLYDSGGSNSAARRTGCTTVGETNIGITLTSSTWTPAVDITASPNDNGAKDVTSDTVPLTITVSVPVSITNLVVEILPIYVTTDRSRYESKILTLTKPSIINGQHQFVFKDVKLPDIAWSGYLRIWELGKEQHALVPFALGGGWGPDRFAWGPDRFAWGPDRFAWGTGVTGWNAPVSSGNGQVTLFNIASTFGTTPPYIIQRLPPNADTKLRFTPIGDVYRITLDNKTRLASTSILFNYLERDLPNPVWEDKIAIYYKPALDTEFWEEVPTSLNKTLNLAAAPARGTGVYALGMTASIPLTQGCNLIGYPMRSSLSITELLTFVSSQIQEQQAEKPIQIVIGDSQNHQWIRYDNSSAKTDSVSTTVVTPTVEPCALDPKALQLNELQFGHGYWISVTAPVTLTFPVDVVGVDYEPSKR